MQVCVSQQEQEATSLVTLTPTSGPCFIYEAKLNNFPLFVHKHTWTDCNTNKSLVMTRPLKNLQASAATKLGEEERQCGFPPQNQTSAWAERKGANCVTSMSLEPFMTSLTLTFSGMLQFVSLSA